MHFKYNISVNTVNIITVSRNNTFYRYRVQRQQMTLQVKHNTISIWNFYIYRLQEHIQSGETKGVKVANNNYRYIGNHN